MILCLLCIFDVHVRIYRDRDIKITGITINHGKIPDVWYYHLNSNYHACENMAEGTSTDRAPEIRG